MIYLSRSFRAKLVLAASLLSTSAWAQNTSVVDLGYASYEGTLNPTTGVTNFLGIRYASPPLGDLRWQAPQPPQNVTGVQSADTQPNQCFQSGNGQSPTNPLRDLEEGTGLERRAVEQSEDCLFLNVHIPGSLPSNDSLPVLVWIHGGGYISGSANSDGGDIVRESLNGVIAVVIQYRLGLFGFLPGNEVKANGSLNAGLLDQDFALQWVQTHISKFGGDPTKVTIWGESAGAGSVLQQVIARDGQTDPPLFRGAITSSTFLPSQYVYNETIPQGLYDEVVAQSNCTGATDTLSCLREVDASVLETANTQINGGGFFGTFVFVPVIDGEFIVRRPIESMQQRRVNGQALLAMTNTNEGLPFVNQSTASTVNAANYSFLLFPKLDEQTAEEAGAKYEGTGTAGEQLVLVQGEAIFICPTYFLLSAFPNASYKGKFAIPPASHGDDVIYYFPGGNTPPFNNTEFIKAFSQSFMNFIISLDPNDKIDPTNITPAWAQFNGTDTEMLFNRTEDGQPDVRAFQTDEALLDRCSFWESIGGVTGQ